jgi:hypothetical protein
MTWQSHISSWLYDHSKRWGGFRVLQVKFIFSNFFNYDPIVLKFGNQISYLIFLEHAEILKQGIQHQQKC